jgi:alpha/beta superfamily hydrolase
VDLATAMDTAPLTPPTPKTRHPEKHLMLTGPAGRIEARVMRPLADSPHHAVAVICHPHPLHGGNLDNKVTLTLARTLSAMGVPALRFNFRGVGASVGDFAAGIGETEDLLAVIRQAQSLYPDRALWLAGFSFGAYVALRATRFVAVKRLITVAPPVNLYDFTELTAPDCPWLLIQGTADEVVPYKDVLKWATRLYPAPESLYLAGVDHYFHGKLKTLQTAVTDHITAHSASRRTAHFA